MSVVVGAYEDAASAVEALAQAGGKRPAAVLPRDAVDDEARLRLRQAQVECLTTLDGGDMDAARWLAATLAQAQGWEPADPHGVPTGGSAPGDVIGWCERRIGSGALTTDRPITRLHGAQQYIASFNLLGQGRLNQACGDLLYRRLMDEGVAPDEVFDVMVCSESKAVGMVQVVAECFGQDRYVVLRKGLKNYMPRRPREPLVEDATSITTAGRRRWCWIRSTAAAGGPPGAAGGRRHRHRGHRPRGRPAAGARGRRVTAAATVLRRARAAAPARGARAAAALRAVISPTSDKEPSDGSDDQPHHRRPDRLSAYRAAPSGSARGASSSSRRSSGSTITSRACAIASRRTGTWPWPPRSSIGWSRASASAHRRRHRARPLDPRKVDITDMVRDVQPRWRPSRPRGCRPGWSATAWAGRWRGSRARASTG